MVAHSRRELIRLAGRVGVGIGGIALVGCASPEVYNSRDQQASDEASAPSPQEPEQVEPSVTPVAVQPSLPVGRSTPVPAGVEVRYCTRPSQQYSNDLSFGTETVPRVVVDPLVWRERYHWRTLPVRRGAAPSDTDVTFNSDRKSLWHWEAVDSAVWLPLLYNQLVVLAAGDGVDAHRAALEGDLAERWETPDAATIIFTLREGVSWPNRDGGWARPLTAADVAAVHETYRAPESRQSGVYRSVTAIAADDDARTVAFSLSEPDVSLLLAMTGSSHVITPPDWSFTDPSAVPPPGTGPFQIAEWSGPDDAWRFTRSPGYFKRDAMDRPLPYLGGIRGGLPPDEGVDPDCPVTPQEEWGRWLVGAVDAIAPRHPGELAASLDDVAGTVAQVAAPMPGRGWALEFPRNAEQPITDPRVRRAVSMAVDRSLLAEQWEGGLAAPDCGMNWMFVEDGQGGFREWPWTLDELGTEYRQDQQAVQELLAAAGYSRQEPLRLSLLPGTDTSSLRGIDSFTRIGRLASMLSTGSAGIIRAAPLTSDPDWDELQFHVNPESGHAYLAVPEANLALSASSALYPVACDPTTYTPPPDFDHRQDTEDPRVAELWQQQRRTADPIERSRVLEELRQRRSELMETVHLINRYGLHARRPNVHNLVITAFAHNPLQQAKQLERTWLSTEAGAG